MCARRQVVHSGAGRMTSRQGLPEDLWGLARWAAADSFSICEHHGWLQAAGDVPADAPLDGQCAPEAGRAATEDERAEKRRAACMAAHQLSRAAPHRLPWCLGVWSRCNEVHASNNLPPEFWPPSQLLAAYPGAAVSTADCCADKAAGCTCKHMRT